MTSETGLGATNCWCRGYVEGLRVGVASEILFGCKESLTAILMSRALKPTLPAARHPSS
jgi:hypothetical protein